MKKCKKLLLSFFCLVLAVAMCGQTAEASMTVKSQYDETTIVHGSEHKGKKYVYGIDVSRHQGIIDWDKVKKAGVEFAIIRLGYAQLADGQPRLDNRYEYNIAHAKAAGLKVGVYFYSQATNAEEAKAEVDFIMSHLKGTALDLPVVYDAECGTQSNGKPGKLGAAKLSKAEWTKVAVAFCDAVQSYGYQAMFYGSISKILNKIDHKTIDSKYQMWIARYKKSGDSSAHQLVTTQYPYSGEYEYWQYSDHGHVSGITPVVDLDLMYVASGDSRFKGAGIVGQDPTPVTPTASEDYTKSIGTMKTNKSAPIRATASNSAKQVKKLSKNTKVTAYGTKGSGSSQWIRVKYTKSGKEYKGYMQAKYLNPIVSNPSSFRKTACEETSVTLSWKKASGATGYEIYRSNAKNGTYKKIAKVTGDTTTTYTVKSLDKNMIYYYKIRAYKTIGSRTSYSAYKETSGGTKEAAPWNVKAKKAEKLRQYAGTSYKTITRVPKNAKLKVVYRARDKKNKEWYKVQYKKGSKTYTGFIAKSSTRK